MHVTNQYLDLAPVVQQQANHAGLQAVLIISDSDASQDINRADWVLVSANTNFFLLPEVDAARENFSTRKNLRLWDDDYNSLLPVVRWQRRKER